jgi:hypothetical protein
MGRVITALREPMHRLALIAEDADVVTLVWR